MPTVDEINSIEYWEEQKRLAMNDFGRASSGEADRRQAMEIVADCDHQIRLLRQMGVSKKGGLLVP